MKQIYLGLAIHNHQPLGNFPWVFEDAFQHAYQPLIEALERHPMINVSLHYSGCLIDWLKQNHPDFFVLLKKLIARGQVEMMSGGYYEPILSAIPDADKLGQIDKLSEFIIKEFDTRPSGMWLAERVWEPYLTRILAEAGIIWTLVDDTAFKMVGLSDAELSGYFITEEQGNYIKVYPISKYLRYSIPWHDVDRVIDYLGQEASEEENKIIILGDDGEKFGIWPGTYKHCWEKHWIEDFFKAVENSADWLHTIRLGDHAAKHEPAGRIYLPCASYDEMLEWSLPAEKSWAYSELKRSLVDAGNTEITQFLYCGFWRNFLIKYPEINRMHKKMLRVHDKVYRAKSVSKADCGMDDLWKSQCNCPYWHGVFGGVYLSDIRATAYANLIKAETKADSVLQSYAAGVGWQQTDFDGDGMQEMLIEGCHFNFYLSPSEGGTAFEWDLRRQGYNLLGTLPRRREGYHQALIEHGIQQENCKAEQKISSIHDAIRIKNKDFARYLVYDNLPRHSMLDHFLKTATTLEEFQRNEFTELGRFAVSPYKVKTRPNGHNMHVNMQCFNKLDAGSKMVEFSVEKSFTIFDMEERISIDYQFVNLGEVAIESIFGNEWNINLLGGGHNDGAYYRLSDRMLDDTHLDSSGQLDNVQQLSMGNIQLGIEIELTLERPLSVWRFPVESLSNSEGGVERMYQCSCLVILLPLYLEAGEKKSFHYQWRVI